jgi:TolB-like protein
MIDGKTGFHLWSRGLEHDLANIFSLQDDLAREVLGAMSVSVEPVRSVREPPSPHPRL